MTGYRRIRGIHRLVHAGCEVVEIGTGTGTEKRSEMMEVGRTATAGIEKAEVGERVFAAVPRNWW